MLPTSCTLFRLAPVLVASLFAAVVGCGEDAESPAGPEPAPALATTAAKVLSFRQVRAGSFYTCGVTTDDVAYCWGGNSNGRLGDGSTSPRHTPVAVAGGLRFRQVDASVHHTCGATTADRAYCWGRNSEGQLGD